MIIDIHCHASLKQYIFKDKITDSHTLLLPDFLPFGMHADLHSLNKGGVKVVVCSHYLPEYNFRDTTILGIPSRWFIDYIESIRILAEDRSYNTKPFEQLTKIMKDFENEIFKARQEKGFNVTIARNLIELKQELTKESIVFLHSVEGSHGLGYGLSAKAIKANLDLLIAMGLCLFTLAHFFENSITPSQGGIPPTLRKNLNLNVVPNPDKGLTEIGKEIVKYLFDKGVIIDLVHCTPKARQEVFEINNNRSQPRPIVFSHTGLRSIAEFGEISNYPNDLYVLPSDEEVKQIIRTRGVIGIILMNYWVNGNEDKNLFKRENGIPYIIRTINKICELEKNVNPNYCCDHISIGTDFDGFSEVPDDLISASALPNLTTALKEAGYSDENIEKICWKNFMRVLDNGWWIK